jgi:protein-S-isoprenylcysteine O-methyltransferase Ste14
MRGWPLPTGRCASGNQLLLGSKNIALGGHGACKAGTFVPMLDFVYQHLPVLAVVAVFAERMREVFAKRTVVSGQKKETLTFTLFMLCGQLIVLGGIAEYYVRHLTLRWPLFIVGLLLSIASFVIRRSAIRALGRFWSLHVEMRERHEFVQTGPFAYARHPVYFSMILELLGIGMMLGAWWTLTFAFLLFVPTMVARVRIEERAMIAQFGDAYRAYMRRTPAIFPTLPKKSEVSSS